MVQLFFLHFWGERQTEYLLTIEWPHNFLPKRGDIILPQTWKEAVSKWERKLKKENTDFEPLVSYPGEYKLKELEYSKNLIRLVLWHESEPGFEDL